MKRTRVVSQLLAIVFISLIIFAPNTAKALEAISLSPASGMLAGGNKVTIRGKGFRKTKTEEFSDIAAGVEHAVMLSKSGQVWTLGINSYGQLGNGNDNMNYFASTPQNITKKFNLDSNDVIISVAAGDYSSFAISRNGRVFAWGRNDKSQLGIGNMIKQTSPVELTDKFSLELGENISRIESGVATTFALTDMGRIYVWGDSSKYQDGQQNESYVAIQTPKLATWLGENISDISLGYKTGIIVDNREMVFTWGRNKDGEMGRTKPGKRNDISEHKTTYHIQNNFDLAEGDYIVDVEAGYGVMAVLTHYNQVYIWGGNRLNMLGLDGEMANPDDEDTGDDVSSAPINITDKFDIAADDCIAEISIGNSHVLAVSQYGRVFSWGTGRYGQLGTNNTLDQPAITEITDMFNLADNVQIMHVLAAGAGDEQKSSYSYAIDDTGAVYGWGGDKLGKPGINSLTNTMIPKLISDRVSARVSNIAGISFGDQIVDNFNVVGDETIVALAPAGIEAGKVSVTITDYDGNTAETTQSYTYLAEDIDLDDNDNSDNDDGTNDDGDNNSDDDPDDNKDDNDNSSKDDAQTDGNPTLDELLEILGKDSALKPVSGGSNVRVSAPNTGYGFDRKLCLW